VAKQFVLLFLEIVDIGPGDRDEVRITEEEFMTVEVEGACRVQRLRISEAKREGGSERSWLRNG
jgi:hypothetical protein